MPLSHSPYLRLASSAFATIFLGFGINAMLRPENGLTFFEFEQPTTDKRIVNDLMIVYGARDIFMGIAIYAAAYFAHPKALGWIMVAGSAVAFVDGAVVYNSPVAHGEMNHWGYAPILGAVGVILLGIFDRV
jgi:hypothetical protein